MLYLKCTICFFETYGFVWLWWCSSSVCCNRYKGIPTVPKVYHCKTQNSPTY